MFAAIIIEVNRWCRCWLVQRSQGKHVWYGCWRVPALKQMDCTDLGTMCLEIFSPMQRGNSFRIKWIFRIVFRLWKGIIFYILWFCYWDGRTSSILVGMYLNAEAQSAMLTWEIQQLRTNLEGFMWGHTCDNQIWYKNSRTTALTQYHFICLLDLTYSNAELACRWYDIITVLRRGKHLLSLLVT